MRDGVFVLLTGLPCSGKTTIAELTKQTLKKCKYLTIVLDGDQLRKTICSDLGFDKNDRQQNLQRVAYMGKMLIEEGFIVLAAFIAPYESVRQKMMEIIGPEFITVFVDCPLSVCQKRDVKGMYAKALTGKIVGFTGVDSPYENPINPDLTLHTNDKSVLDCTESLIELLRERTK